MSSHAARLRPAVFMDRDGCLTEEVGYVNHPSRIRLLPRTAGAVRRLNQAGIAAVMVTNQAGVAANVVHSFYDGNNLVVTNVSDILSAGQTNYYDLALINSLNYGYSGHVTISADQPISRRAKSSGNSAAGRTAAGPRRGNL